MNQLDAAQEAAVQRALTLGGFALFFEPRVGKTRTALEIANRRTDVRRLIIVAPKSVLGVWEAAIGAGELRAGIIVELINFESFNSKKRRKQHRDNARSTLTMVIVDEAHKIKRRTAKQSKGIRTLVALSRYRLALTATSFDQGPEQSWPIFDFINPEIFGKYDQFQERYLKMGGFKGYKVVGYQNEEEYKRLFHENSARICLSDVSEKPIKIQRQIHKLKLPPKIRQMYDQLEKNLFVEHDGMRVTARLEIVLSTRLQQLTGGWLCNKGEEPKLVHTVKLDKLQDIIAEHVPCVIVCRYRHEMDDIEQTLNPAGNGYSTLMVRGGEPLLSPRPNVDIVVIQTSAGLGIDLSQANTIIFYSWDYSYINYEQMRFRVLSRKQTFARNVFLMIEHSIDEPIYAAAVRKQKLSTAIHDYKESRWAAS